MLSIRGRIRSALAGAAVAAIAFALLARGKLLTLAVLSPFLAGLVLPWPLVLRTAKQLDPRGLLRPAARGVGRADYGGVAFLAFFWLLVIVVVVSLACLGVREVNSRVGEFSRANP